VSKGRKSSYPERPLLGKRPSAPGEQRKKPSRTSGGGKRKAWVSIRENIQNGVDVSPRLNFPWWKSPMMKAARLRKARRKGTPND